MNRASAAATKNNVSTKRLLLYLTRKLMATIAAFDMMRMVNTLELSKRGKKEENLFVAIAT